MALKKSELYSSLWSSCDELRGGMDASQYKDYVLVLLFIKYISDKYAGMPYAPITIPEGASFKDMVALKGKSDIGDQINKKIIGPLANANKLSDMPDFNDATKLGSGKEMVDRLTNLIAIFENKALDFSKNRAEGDDILGDAYEYLMRHFATESGKSKGQFYTPAEVSRIMAQIIGIRDARTTSATTVYDPTCGSGSLLLKVSDEASAKVTLYGQEKDAATSGLARMNMILHDNPTALIMQGNTLADPKFKDGDTLKTFDYVVANPPFSDKRWSTGIDPLNDPHERFNRFGTPPARQGDYAYLLHIVRSLKSTGKGACILPHGVLFRGNAEAEIRRNLVRKGYIKGIIGLPANLFYGTGIPACIVVIDKEHAQARKGIFMIDAGVSDVGNMTIECFSDGVFAVYFCQGNVVKQYLGSFLERVKSMADAKQLARLKKGSKVWHNWRKSNPEVTINLREAKLSGEDLSGTNLTRADLVSADLSRAILIKADFIGANLTKSTLIGANFIRARLSEAILAETDLRGANLIRAVVSGANLTDADLREVNLIGADLRGATLVGANLSGANLSGANLSGAALSESNFSDAFVGSTIFGNSDLSKVMGLENAVHRSPSSIATDTFIQSNGKIPELFLRGCGLSDWEIDGVKLYDPDLRNDEVRKILHRMYDLRAIQTLQISPLFISYSHADHSFVEKLEFQLNRKGIRFWRDTHDATAGRLEKQIDRAIHENPTVLLILSSNSNRSEWVEHEIRTARGLESKMKRDILCPVALDDSWKDSPWPKRIMDQIKEYNILDFSEWQVDAKFESIFRKLIDGLELFYKG